jgi:uncharacterized protein YdaU (DUF1376 family)
MHYYNKHIKDYKTDTAHLSLLEHGAYNMLIDLYILSENPLEPNLSKLCRLINARTDDEIAAVTNILDEFFTKTDDGYRQKKCDAELEKIFSRSEKARISAKVRWDNKGNANASPKHSERNATQHPKPNTTIPNNNEPLFVEFWKLYPHRNGTGVTKPQSLEWWNTKSLETITMVLDGTKKFRNYIERCHKDNVFNGGIPDPIRYLKNKRYKDDFKVVRKKSAYDNIK